MDDEIQEKPTPSEDASIQERLESYLSAEDGDQPQPTPAEEAAAETPVETEDDVPEQSDEPQLTTTDLAKVLGIDEDMLDSDEEGQLFIKTKIDGQEGRAKFEDFLKAYQTQGHIDNKAREVAEQQRQAQEAFAQQQQAIHQRMQYAEDVANLAMQALVQESQAIDWAALARDDPAEYVAKQHEFGARKAQIDQSFHAINQHREEASRNAVAQHQQYLAQQAQRLPELIPEWKNSDVARKEMTELKEWGVKSGLTAEEVATVANSVHVAIMRKAMLFDRMQQTKADVEKKVRIAPKLVKAGQPANETRGEKTVRDLKTAIKKSGGNQGVVDYLLATGKA